MAKNLPDLKVAQKAVERVLSGGQLDRVVSVDTQLAARREEAALSVRRWTVSLNQGADELFIELAQAQGLPVSSRPEKAQLAVRHTEEGAFLLLKPCRQDDEGAKVTQPRKKRPASVSRLQTFLKRNKIVPLVGTVLVSDVSIGRDADFGRCLIANMTTARVREIERKPKKSKSAAKPAAPAKENAATPPGTGVTSPATPPALGGTPPTAPQAPRAEA